MILTTPVQIPESSSRISYDSRLMLIGSCFTESMGEFLVASKFRTDVNPFGNLYNPMSIADSVRSLLYPRDFTERDLFLQDGVYHSFAHHSRFSSPDKEVCLQWINERVRRSSDFIREADYLVLTFGTSFVYRLKSNGRIVANCHKLPESYFTRSRLSVREMAEMWQRLLLTIWEHLPDIKLIFTVSPIRHLRDGAHENQVSKSALIVLIDHLQSLYPERIAYFPAYELMMDELRDYRFYADDMVHPSAMAVNYIRERFRDTYMDRETIAVMEEVEQVAKALQHKPFNPESVNYKRFLMQTLLKIERLKEKFPYFDFANEVELLNRKLGI